MKSSHCCPQCTGSSRLSYLLRYTSGQWGNWALTQVYGKPCFTLLPLRHGAESWHSISAAFGTWVSLKFHQGKEKNFRGIWSTISFPSSKTNDQLVTEWMHSALSPATPVALGPRGRAGLSLDVAAQPNATQQGLNSPMGITSLMQPNCSWMSKGEL